LNGVVEQVCCPAQTLPLKLQPEIAVQAADVVYEAQVRLAVTAQVAPLIQLHVVFVAQSAALFNALQAAAGVVAAVVAAGVVPPHEIAPTKRAPKATAVNGLFLKIVII
jgi:hypothetical protein